MNPYSYGSMPYDHNLIQNVEKAINGQYSAIQCYSQLAESAPSEEQKKRILEIRQDEVRHYHTFSGIYTNLTGHQPAPKITESCPKDYVRGLKFAVEDEQKTVDFYREIADKTQDPYIQSAFRRAAEDEQNHAVWFLYFYTRICCESK
ncbi:MAG TPA: ferritin-like domain-containing protein [Bacillales bacterium]|nr:ferritin-like domain-containing protein [Bacillales bacterium]